MAKAGEATRRTYVSPAQAAAYLGVGERTIRKLIAEGRLPAYRVAGHRRVARIKQSDLDALLVVIPTVER